MICAQAVQLFVTRWTVDCQAPLSMGFLKQEYWSGLPFPSPGDLLSLLHWQVDSLLLASPRKPHVCVCVSVCVSVCVCIHNEILFSLKKEGN